MEWGAGVRGGEWGGGEIETCLYTEKENIFLKINNPLKLDKQTKYVPCSYANKESADSHLRGGLFCITVFSCFFLLRFVFFFVSKNNFLRAAVAAALEASRNHQRSKPLHDLSRSSLQTVSL